MNPSVPPSEHGSNDAGLFASAFEFAAIGIALVAPDGRWIRVNRALCEMLGYSEPELRERSFQELTHPDDLARDLELMSQLLAGKRETYQMEKRYVHKSGEIVWGLLSVSLIRDENSQPRTFLSQIQNITERKRAIGELEQFFSLSPDLLAITGLDGYLRQVNPAWTAVLGWSEAELLSMPVIELVHPDDRAAALEARRQLAAGKPVLDIENRYRCKDGSYRWLSWRSVALADEGIVFAVARDVSRRRAEEEERRELANRLELAREAAESANEAKSEFLAMMSHEIRTPMNAVIGFCELLRHTELSAEQADYVANIERGGSNLIEIINGILDFSKMKAGVVDVHYAPLDLHALIDEVHDLLSPLAQMRGIALRKQLAADVPRLIESDARALKRILTNLVGNAIKFTEAGRVEIDVACKSGRHGRMLCVSVTDTGIGLTAETLARLFQPFVQGDSAHHRKFGGTGLGLSISRHLAEAMGGSLGAWPRGDARGSVFQLSIPLMVSDEPLPTGDNPTKVPAEIAPPPGLRILIAEDNATNRRLLIKLLKRLGCRCNSVGDGRDVLDAIEQEEFDVILMDVQMPVMDGIAATREIRRREAADSGRRRLYIIGQTAYATVDDAKRCLDAGMDMHLGKPIRLESLAQALAAGGAALKVAADA